MHTRKSRKIQRWYTATTKKTDAVKHVLPILRTDVTEATLFWNSRQCA